MICKQCKTDKHEDQFRCQGKVKSNGKEIYLVKRKICKSCAYLNKREAEARNGTRPQALLNRKNSIRKLKLEVFAAYGNKCVCCNEKELSFLSIDHIFNDGNEDLMASGVRKSGAMLYYELKRNGFPKDKFQLLCYNCNWGKYLNNGICPHSIK